MTLVLSTYVHRYYTKEQKRNKNGIQTFRFSFVYSIKILTFVNSKSSTLKSGAKWLNFKAKL